MFITNLCKKGEFFLLFFLLFFCNLSALEKAVWATPWDIDSKEKIDNMINKLCECGINTIIAEVRYRGDALYFPNKYDSSYPNEEPRYHKLSNSDFDPLEYLSEICQQRGLRLVAWLTTFVVTGNETDNIGLEHPYLTYPFWITHNSHGDRMLPQKEEGAYFDPAIPEVQDYLYNVFMDVVNNYKIDGIQMDYIRYPSKEYGYNPLALKLFKESNFVDFQEFKRSNISNFVKKVFEGAKKINPQLTVSAAVFANYDDAYYTRSQDWVKWLQDGIIDKVYLMAYAKENKIIKEQLAFASSLKEKKQIVVGLRSWDDDNAYRGKEILTKIRATLDKDFGGIAFFSHYGIKSQNYYKFIKQGLNEN